MLRTVLFVASLAGLIAVGLPLDPGSAQAAPMTCREAAKTKFPGDFHNRAAYRKACKAAWKAQKLNPQPLPPKA